MKNLVMASLLAGGLLMSTQGKAEDNLTRANNAVACIVNKVQPEDYQKFIDGNMWPYGRVKRNASGEKRCEPLTKDEKETRSSIGETYVENLFSACNVGEMYNFAGFRVHITDKAMNGLAERDRSFAEKYSDASSAKEVCR